MAFMALFGWIFIPIILLALVVQAVTAPLMWALAHPGLINAVAAGLLALNLLVLALLLRARKRRKQRGEKPGWLLLLAALWEAWVVFLCALFLLVRPLRFIPEDFGQPFDVESVCYDEWEIIACQGIPSGYTRTPEEIEQYLGTRITYGPSQLISDGQTYALDPEEPYDEKTVWREEMLYIPDSLVTSSFGGIGLTDRKLRRAIANFQEELEKRPIGWLFYMQDRNTLIIYYDCIFFQAKRASALEALEKPS